jgi:fructosamine-3-kinase
MSRTGVEAKLPWRQVPKAVRQQVEAALGAPVARASRIWGGYSPAPTFRLALADGRRAFFKATNGDSNEFSTKALYVEERVYQELGALLVDWIPQYHATINHADWHGLLLEDLGPKSVPPWTPALARGISHALANFHRATLGMELPDWITRPEQRLASKSWQRVVEQTENFQKLAVWAGEVAPEAVAWLQMVSPMIDDLMQRPVLATEPFSLLHGDLRSDNLRFRQGRLSLFDWPAITVGRPEWDFVAFAQTVTVEGGVAPEQVLAWYGEKFPVDNAAVDSSIAWFFCFFADYGWRGEIPGLPRVRRFQRQQLGVMAQWAGRQWALPEATWANELLK